MTTDSPSEARERARAALREADRFHLHTSYPEHRRVWTKRVCRCGWEHGPEGWADAWEAHRHDATLDALLLPSDCSTCGGVGTVAAPDDENGCDSPDCPCPDCEGTGKRPALIEELAAERWEQVGVGDRFGLAAQLTPTHAMKVAAESSQPLRDGEPYGGWFAVFRKLPMTPGDESQ